MNFDLLSLITGLLIALIAVFAGEILSYYFKRKGEKRQVKSLLFAIRAEIMSVWNEYEQQVGQIVESLKKGEGFEFYYSISDNYFTIYDNNTNLIGLLDKECSELIVNTYVSAKGLKDSFLFNNQILGKLETYEELTKNNSNTNHLEKQQILLKNWQQYGEKIQQSHYKLKELKEKLTNYIDNNAC